MTYERPPEGLEKLFELVRPIGSGATSRVWLAIQRSLRRPVALKLLANPGPDMVGRFLAEARILAALQHPAIVKLFDFGQLGEHLYLATEYVAAGSLADRLAQGPLPWPLAAHVAERLASGLERVHAAGILHRDLKPANVLLQEGEPRLIDFGFARLEGGPSLTQSGIIIATPAYASPEQLEGGSLGAATDLYSLGVVLYHMVSGVNPFEGPSFPETLHRHLNLRPESLPPMPAGTPPALDKLTRRLLRKSPDHRPASAAEVARALEALVPAVTSLTPDENLPTRGPAPGPALTPAPGTGPIPGPGPGPTPGAFSGTMQIPREGGGREAIRDASWRELADELGEGAPAPASTARSRAPSRRILGFVAGIALAAGIVAAGREVGRGGRAGGPGNPPGSAGAETGAAARTGIPDPGEVPAPALPSTPGAGGPTRVSPSGVLDLRWNPHHLVVEPRVALDPSTGLTLKLVRSGILTSVTSSPFVFRDIPAGAEAVLGGRLAGSGERFEESVRSPEMLEVHDLRILPSDRGARVSFLARGPGPLEVRATAEDGTVSRAGIAAASDPGHGTAGMPDGPTPIAGAPASRDLRHVVVELEGLASDRSHRLDILPRDLWGGLTGVIFRTTPPRPSLLAGLVDPADVGRPLDPTAEAHLLETSDPGALPALRALAARRSRVELLTDVTARLAWFRDDTGGRAVTAALEKDPATWARLDPLVRARLLADLGRCRTRTALMRAALPLLEVVDSLKILPEDERVDLLTGLVFHAAALDGEEGDAALRRVLEASAPRVETLFTVLAEDRARAERILRSWAGAADTPDAPRQLAMIGLGVLGRPEDVESLEYFARDRGSSRLRAQAVTGLLWHGAIAADKAVASLAERPAHPDRLWPAVMLGREGFAETVWTWLERTMRTSEKRGDTAGRARQRMDLVCALGILGHEEADELLEAALEDASPHVRRAAIWALARRGWSGLGPALARELAGEEPEDVALWAAGERRDRSLVPRLSALAAGWNVSRRPRDQVHLALAGWALTRLGVEPPAMSPEAPRPSWIATLLEWGRHGPPEGHDLHVFFPFVPRLPIDLAIWPEETVEITCLGLWGEPASPAGRVPAARTLEAWAGPRPVATGHLARSTGIRSERREVWLSAAPPTSDVRVVPHPQMEGVAFVLTRKSTSKD